jgi:hypothetical protein
MPVKKESSSHAPEIIVLPSSLMAMEHPVYLAAAPITHAAGAKSLGYGIMRNRLAYHGPVRSTRDTLT